MKVSIKHLAWVCVLLCGNVSGQSATYTVKPGDSLSRIARSQGCTVEALAKANGIKLSAIIQAGQTLKLPGKIPAATTDGSHLIQPGDTFSSISRKYGVPVESLLAANPGLDPKTLKPGQKVRLAAPATPAVAETMAPREPAPVSSPPETEVASPSPEAPTETSEATPSPARKEPIRTVMVEEEITFGDFAAKHGTEIQRLNQLNGLDLTRATVLAKGSELYVPSQP